jgi:hypothetical protein
MVAIVGVDRVEWVHLFRRSVAGVVGDVGGGRDGVLHPFGYCAIIMAFACVHDRFGAVGPACQRRGARTELIAAARGVLGGVASLDPINHGEGGGRGEVPYLAIRIHPPCNSSPSRPCAPPLRICLRSLRFRCHPCFSAAVLALPPPSLLPALVPNPPQFGCWNLSGGPGRR